MDVKKLFLSYYTTATEDFHIAKITSPTRAKIPHMHGYYQIYYLLSGRLVHHLEDSEAVLGEGDVFILPPDTPHYIDEVGAGVSFYSMSFMPDYFSGIRESNKVVADFLYYLKTAAKNKILPKFNIPSEDALFASGIFDRIMREFSDKGQGSAEIIKACSSVLLTIFARTYFEEDGRPLYTEQLRQSVMHCIEYIKIHFDEPLTLDEILRRAAMSKTSFCQIFKSITGKSFKDFLNEIRIKKAAALILSGEKITSASTLVGFEYFSTFYRNFKSVMGISPAEFQKSAKNAN